MSNDPADSFDISGDEVRIFVDQEVIMLKAVSGTDPVELTAADARDIAAHLLKLAEKYSQ